MNNIFNLNPATSVLPFKWYPVTELFRDFLREKTLPEGLCILERVTNKRIFIDHGVDRDIFIDNYLVGDFSVRHGKSYCEVALDNVIMLGRQSVSSKILEAVESSPPLRRDPFVADNLQFQVLRKDVQSDGEDFGDIINEIHVQMIPDLLAVIKYFYTRLGDKETVDKALGDVVSMMSPELEYNDLTEMLKIAALMLEDKRSAERILQLLNGTHNNTRNHIQTAAIRKYILNKKTENSEILQKSFSMVSETNSWVKTVRELAIYFDFNYARDVYKKGLKHLKYSFNYLDACYLAEFLLEDAETAKNNLTKGKELALIEADAAYFHFFSLTVNKEREFAEELLQLHDPLKDEIEKDIPFYLTNVKYLEENPDKYHKLVQQLIDSDLTSFDLLEIAFDLSNYNSLADDLGIFYEAAKDRAESSMDYTNLARWGMEYDPSKERESAHCLKEADQLAESPEDHLELGALLARNGKGKFAEKHLKKAQSESDFTDELIEIAEAWYELDKKENARRALYKAEKFAVFERDFKEIATLWMMWFNDTESSRRCVEKSVEAGWSE